MRNPLKTQRSTDLGLLCARVPLGVIFVIAGCNRLAHEGFQQFAAQEMRSVPSWISPAAAKVYLQSLPFLAIIAGLLLVLGLLTRGAGFVATFILITVISVTGYRADALPNSNFVLLGVALLTFLTGGGGMSLDKTFFGKSNPD